MNFKEILLELELFKQIFYNCNVYSTIYKVDWKKNRTFENVKIIFILYPSSSCANLSNIAVRVIIKLLSISNDRYYNATRGNDKQVPENSFPPSRRLLTDEEIHFLNFAHKEK